MNVSELQREADRLKAEAEAAQKKLDDALYAEARAKPLLERLTFAATFRCLCGHGMAYDPTERGVCQWECSAILRHKAGELDVADATVTHEAPAPFAFYEVKSENQPSAGGMTTRPTPGSKGSGVKPR